MEKTTKNRKRDSEVQKKKVLEVFDSGYSLENIELVLFIMHKIMKLCFLGTRPCEAAQKE